MKETLQYKVIVSDRACYILAGHIRFLAQKSPAAARKIKNDLMSSILSQYQMPERFPLLEDEFIPPNKYHKLFVEKWYLILRIGRYTLTASWTAGGIMVGWYGRQRYNENMRKEQQGIGFEPYRSFDGLAKISGSVSETSWYPA